MEVRGRRAPLAAAFACLAGLSGTAQAQCTADSQCKAPRRCVAGACAWVECAFDTQCKGEAICEGGICTPAGRALKPAALPPQTNAARRRLLNALVPFKDGVIRFKDGLARDPRDARAAVRLGETRLAALEAGQPPLTIALIHAEGYDGGNNWQSIVAVWRGDATLTAVGELVVHDMQGQVTGVDVEGQTLIVHLRRMGPDDPRCCPSQLSSIRLRVSNGVLKPLSHQKGLDCNPTGQCFL